jgi:hypothetical protein
LGTETTADVRYICPQCGGRVATATGLIVVQTCWACRGVGTLTAEQLDAYEAQLFDAARVGVIL